MNLYLVQHSGLERPLRCVRAVHQHMSVAGGGFRLRHRASDSIGHVCNQRIVRHCGTGWAVAGYEDLDTVTITAPVINLLHCTPTREDSSVRVRLIEQRADRSGWPREIAVPLVQAHETITARVVRGVVGTGYTRQVTSTCRALM